MTKSLAPEVSDLERVLGLTERPGRRPMLVIASGRGRTGKSTLLSYLAATCSQALPARCGGRRPKEQLPRQPAP
jgi:Mrp family chromosome partitioning ATPase